MANLNIQNLSQIVQSGDVEKLFTGTRSAASAEGTAAAELQNQGFQPQPPQEVAKTFSDILRDSVEKVNLYQTQADTAIKELVAGRNKNIHETMLTIERADTSLKLMMQVRNKILDAYREIMRMQV
jgi:flagellar hook-basal body complex protein FliE